MGLEEGRAGRSVRGCAGLGFERPALRPLQPVIREPCCPHGTHLTKGSCRWLASRPGAQVSACRAPLCAAAPDMARISSGSCSQAHMPR